MRIALFVALIVSTLGQSQDVQPFAGRWAADHGGQPVVRLDLRMTAGILSGSIQLADIHLDARGEVETVLSGLSAASTLLDVTSRSGALAFSRRDGNDIDHFELRVIDDRAAELLFIPSEADRRELANAGNSIPIQKPIRLTRVTP
jgi:hypothetical protein